MLIDTLTLYLSKSTEKRKEKKAYQWGLGNHIRLNRVVCKKPIYLLSLSSTFDYGEFARATVMTKKKKKIPACQARSPIQLGFGSVDEFAFCNPVLFYDDIQGR